MSYVSGGFPTLGSRVKGYKNQKILDMAERARRRALGGSRSIPEQYPRLKFRFRKTHICNNCLFGEIMWPSKGIKYKCSMCGGWMQPIKMK